MKFCWKCGKNNDDSVQACVFCGGDVLEDVMSKGEIQESQNTNQIQYDSIGGWLKLAAIGRITGPLLMLFTIIGYYNMLFSKFNIHTTIIGAKSDIPALKSIIVFNFTFSIIAFLVDMTLTYLFFNKKKVFPKAMIAFLIIMLVYFIADYAIYNAFHISIVLVMKQLNRNILAGIVSCIVWIPYFLLSKRVKQTFIH